MRVVHCKKDEFDVYIGRPSKWGNPFSHKDGTLAKYKVNSRKEAIDRYRDWLMNSDDAEELRDNFIEIDNKVLGCWCYPERCHGDILVEVVSEYKRYSSNDFFRKENK